MNNHVSFEDLWSEAEDHAEELIEAGLTPEESSKRVAVFLDSLVPFDVLVPGLPGLALEAADGPLFERIVELIRKKLSKLVTLDPEKRAERKEKRLEKREARRERKRIRRGT